MADDKLVMGESEIMHVVGRPTAGVTDLRVYRNSEGHHIARCNDCGYEGRVGVGPWHCPNCRALISDRPIPERVVMDRMPAGYATVRPPAGHTQDPAFEHDRPTGDEIAP